MKASGVISLEVSIIDLVNDHRDGIRMEGLKTDALATQMAVAHTEYMIKQAALSHDNFQQRADELVRVGAMEVGENVAYGQTDARSVMSSWLGSPGHRKNIEGDFTHIGVAAIKDAQGSYYFTQVFFKR